jgi:hypothetical protein
LSYYLNSLMNYCFWFKCLLLVLCSSHTRKMRELYSNSRQPLLISERLVHYEVNTVMLGNVGSQSCTIIWLTRFSFGLHPSKRHHDTGFAEFPGITKYIELWRSTDSYALRGLRNCGTHKHIGVSASHGSAQCNISQSLWQVNHGGHCEKQQHVKTIP